MCWLVGRTTMSSGYLASAPSSAIPERSVHIRLAVSRHINHTAICHWFHWYQLETFAFPHTDFAYAERVEGYVKGWRRVFHQGSTDHRGTPEAPGRTVTLIEDLQSITWGAAYRLDGTPEEQQETLKYLEWREKQYDLRYRSDVFGKESGSRPLVQGALVYIATPDRKKNVNWLGAAPLNEVAQQIAHAHGPSGPNSEYLYRLADTMRKMEVDDASLFELEAAVRAISETNDTQNLENGRS